MHSERIKKEIAALRRESFSYGEVAGQVGLTRDQVKNFCRKNKLLDKDLGRESITIMDAEKRELIFIDKLLKKYPSVEYISGFVNRMSIVDLRCKECGEIFTRSAQCVHDSKKYKDELCPKCRASARKLETIPKRTIYKKCLYCGNEYIPHGGQKYCSKECYKQNTKKKAREIVKQCIVCGDRFRAAHGGLMYCSDECRKKIRKRNRKKYSRSKERERTERYRENGDIDADITLEKLIEIDKNICHICGEPCNISDGYWKDGAFYTGLRYPTIDHIKPVSKGGTHTWGNIKLAHMLCNSRKSNKEE